MSDKPTAVNDITGDAIRNKPVTDKYAENWERIFGSERMNETLFESGEAIEHNCEENDACRPPSYCYFRDGGITNTREAWAVVMKGGEGPIVGAWWDRETAKDMCSKQPKSHNNVVRKILVLEE